MRHVKIFSKKRTTLFLWFSILWTNKKINKTHVQHKIASFLRFGLCYFPLKYVKQRRWRPCKISSFQFLDYGKQEMIKCTTSVYVKGREYAPKIELYTEIKRFILFNFFKTFNSNTLPRHRSVPTRILSQLMLGNAFCYFFFIHNLSPLLCATRELIWGTPHIEIENEF